MKDRSDRQKVDILQTFALNLDDYFTSLIKCLKNKIKVRILLLQDFELMWQVARSFLPNPKRNWRNDLKILFID